MQPTTTLKWVIKWIHLTDDSIINFLRNNKLSAPLAELLATFNTTVVTYAPNLTQITLQDIIVAYQNWKLNEEQINSIEWFLRYASEYVNIRLWVIDSIEKETSISISDLTEIERRHITEALQGRFKWVKIWDFSWTLTGTTLSTKRSVVDVSLTKDDNSDDWLIQSSITNFLAKIRQNLFMKRNSPEWGWIARSEESPEYIERYLWQLLDLDTPLTKELLKTIPLDLTLEQQKEIIETLLQRLIPEINWGIDYPMVAQMLSVFPDVWRGSRRIKFWKSISSIHLERIMSQDTQWEWNDKFLTLALRRIIIPLRYLLMRRELDEKFLQWQDDKIEIMSSSRIQRVVDEIAIWWEVESNTLAWITDFVISVKSDKEKAKNFLRALCANIIWIPQDKLYYKAVDDLVALYIWKVEWYERKHVSDLTQLFAPSTRDTNITYERIREILMWFVYLRKLKELDMQAEIALKWDKPESDDDMIVLEQAHTAESEVVATVDISETSDVSQEKDDSLEKRSFFIEMCREFESNEVQYKQDIAGLVAEFRQFSDEDRDIILSNLGIHNITSTDEQNSKISDYLIRKYLENSDTCTRMIHVYNWLIKWRRVLDESIIQRDAERVLLWFSSLNSQDQLRFLDAVWIDKELADNLSDIIYERLFWKNQQKNKDREVETQNFDDMVWKFKQKARWLKSWTISKYDRKVFIAALKLLDNEDLKRVIHTTLRNILDPNGWKIIDSRINASYWKTTTLSWNKWWLCKLEDFLKCWADFSIDDLTKEEQEFILHMFIHNYL